MNVRMLALSWMLAAVAAGLVGAEPPQHSSKSTQKAQQTHRPISAIRSDVSRALRDEAMSRRKGDNAPDVLRLVDLYREMANHPERDRSLSLKELGLQIRSRLETVRDRIERRESTAKHIAGDQKPRPSTVAPATHILAQQLPAPAGGAVPAGQGAGPAAAAPREPTARLRSRSRRADSADDLARDLGHQRRQRLGRLFCAAPRTRRSCP